MSNRLTPEELQLLHEYGDTEMVAETYQDWCFTFRQRIYFDTRLVADVRGYCGEDLKRLCIELQHVYYLKELHEKFGLTRIAWARGDLEL